MENIAINNLTMMNVKGYAIYLTTGRRDRTPGVTTSSRMRNIMISHVIADAVDKTSGIQIMGQPGHPIRGVRLDDIRLISNGGGTRADAARQPKELGAGYPEPDRLGVMPAYGVFARHVQDLELDNFHVSFRTNDERPAADFTDIQGLQLDNFQSQTASGVPAARFQDVRGKTIVNSPSLTH